jgi:N-carbamoylputrescine amidase
MKPTTTAALIVNPIGPDRQKNLVQILELANQAVSYGAQLILFPEAALTGLINNDQPSHDLQLGVSIPGPEIIELANFCQINDSWIGIGLLEREGMCLYDTAILLNDKGQIVLHYRRIQTQWHSPLANSNVYCRGSILDKTPTPFGSMAFLICGDLFDDRILSQLKAIRPDLLLFPFARCFDNGTIDQDRWNRDEFPEYLKRVRLADTPALMVNYLADTLLDDGNTFGGAFAVSHTGKVIAQYPLGKPGILMVDLDTVLRG